MGCGCCKKSDVTEPEKRNKSEANAGPENIFDSPFTREALRDQDGTLKPGQIPDVVENAYDKLLDDENFLDIEESFALNPLKANPFVEEWKEVAVSPSKYLQYDQVYNKPPVNDIQPAVLVDLTQNFLSIFDTRNQHIDRLESRIFTRGARAIYLPSQIVLICGGKNSKASYTVDLEKKELKKGNDMFEEREYHSVCYVGDYAMATGGMAYEELNACEIYFRDCWSRTGSMTQARSFHSSVGLEKCIYVIGGMRAKSLEKWSDGKWSILDLALPSNLSRIGVAPLTAYSILVVGGEQSGKGYSLGTWELDVNICKIEQLANLPNIGLFDSCGSLASDNVFLLLAECLYQFNVRSKVWTITKLT